MAMQWKTWEAIGKRHLWFRELLARRVAEWPEERVNACNDFEALERVVKLTERVERHEMRMNRHMERALVLVEVPGRRQ